MAPLENKQYTVGWVCALPLEMAAARSMLDESHGKPLEQHPEDKNSYFLGSIGKHHIAIACLSSYGKVNAAAMATQMLFSFPFIRFGLMVGIGGGIPSKNCDIRLGDVVVSKPKGAFGGVVQHDLVKTVATGESQQTGHLNKPPPVLLNALASLEAEYELGNGMIPEYISTMLSKNKNAKFKAEFSHPGTENDNLYDAEYVHEGSKESKDTCTACDPAKVLRRDKREDSYPVVYHGTIASGDEVVKNARRRDKIGAKFGALCVEMEAAGLMDNFPCIVIRGICDYADSHKNKQWQRYAAAAAAAHAKELLVQVTPQDVDKTPPVADILHSLQDISLDVKDLKERIISGDKDELRGKVLDWIDPRDDHERRHRTIRSEREKDTGLWFVKSHPFDAWLNGGACTLFCPGIPGSGKTFLASLVVDHLLDKFQRKRLSDHRTGVAFLYCDYKLREHQKPFGLLSSLLKQLVGPLPKVPDAVENFYKISANSGRGLTLQELKQALVATTQSYRKVYIVVDALDECEDGGAKSLVRTTQGFATKLMVTSRDVARITSCFGEDDITLRIEAHNEDIKRYIDGHIKSLPAFVEEDPVLEEDVKAGIIKAVQGMFLLAPLHLLSLAGQVSEYGVRNGLKQLAQGEGRLKKTYDDAMGRIQGQSRERRHLAERVLSWIVRGKRLFSPEELRQALAVEQEERELDKTKLPAVGIMVDSCVGLVTVDRESNTIRLVHFTVQEYFVDSKESWLKAAQMDIACTCLTYLLFDTFETGFCPTDKDFENRLRLHPLYDYAAKNWQHHASLTSNRLAIESQEARAKVEELVISFLESTAKVEASSQAMLAIKWHSRLSNYSQEAPRNMTGLHLAAYFGLENEVKLLLHDCSGADPTDSSGRTPLWWAATNGHVATVKLLLKNGAQPDLKNEVVQTPLSRAIEGRKALVVKLLLEKGAKVGYRYKHVSECDTTRGNET